MSFPHLSDALPKLAKPSEVAEMLGLAPVTVYRQMRRGELPAVKVGGRWFVNLERLAEQLGGKAAS